MLIARICNAPDSFLVFIDWDGTLGPYDRDLAWTQYDENKDQRHERVPMRKEATHIITEVLKEIIELGGEIFVLTGGSAENLTPGACINMISAKLIPQDHLLSLSDNQENDFPPTDIPALKTRLMKTIAKSLGISIENVYFVDDDIKNVNTARRKNINTIQVRSDERKASFDLNKEVYGDPKSDAFFGHMNRLLREIKAKYILLTSRGECERTLSGSSPGRLLRTRDEYHFQQKSNLPNLDDEEKSNIEVLDQNPVIKPEPKPEDFVQLSRISPKFLKRRTWSV